MRCHLQQQVRIVGGGKHADSTIPFSLSLFVSGSGSRDGWGKHTDGTIPFSLSLFISALRSRDGWGKHTDGTIPFSLSLFVSASGSRDGLGKYALPLPATGQRCRRGKARRWHRVLLLSPSYISTVPLSRPSQPSLSASLSPPIYTCAA